MLESTKLDLTHFLHISLTPSFFMNAIERRALYNLLRMNWLNDPSLSVESWQVEEYRPLSLMTLFHRLKPYDIQLDRVSFVAYADECDSPEDFTDHLTADRNFSTAQEDQIYLIVFELWRRLMSEKPSLSIICNELDHQIHLYDEGQVEDLSILQNALTRFIQILDENADEGVPPQHVLRLISTYCANDIETFLYDFISEQIDEENETYVRELLDDFDIYLANNKWFKLLHIRLCDEYHNKISQQLIEEVMEEHLNDHDLDYNLEFLSILGEKGFDPLFKTIVQQTLPLIKKEEDFLDLLAISIDYVHRLDQEAQEQTIKAILDKHESFPPEKPIQPDHPDLAALVDLLT